MTHAVQAAYADLYRSLYGPTMARVVHEIGNRESAEDVTAQAFIDLYLSLEREEDVGDLLARLNLIVQSRTRDHLRAKKRRQEDPVGLATELDKLSNAWPLPERMATFPADFDLAIRGLSEPGRDTFILTELRGLSVREAAEVMGTPKSTVADRLQAARTLIREELS